MTRTTQPILFICDMQTKFRDVIHQFDLVEKAICHLCRICQTLSIPILVTTQTQSKLGSCVKSILSCLPECTESYDKSQFSMLTPAVVTVLEREERKEVVIVGIETHICVLQTAMELLKNGYRVVIIADAVSSSSNEERIIALKRMQAAGVVVTSLESWLFETIETSQHAKFHEMQALLKRTRKERRGIVTALL